MSRIKQRIGSSAIGARLRRFLAHEAAGGMIMLFAAAMALLFANSSASPTYTALTEYALGPFPLSLLVNDGLMAIFFLLIGMELKAEMKEGFLAQRSQKILPLVAALGGILTPALIYLAINRHVPEHHAGWAIPTATDIAFAMCVVSLCGRRVPPAAKIFLLALAIYDDLAAIIIIAVVYSHGLDWVALGQAAAILAAMGYANRQGLVSLIFYLVLGAALWYFVHHAGVHSTVAGMATGLLIPMRHHGKNSPSPVNTLMHRLHPYVSFGILPIFAFMNAGVDLRASDLSMVLQPLPMGIALALFLGKQTGIMAAVYACIRLKWAKKPDGVSWVMLYALSIIAGIGFTMSLFIGLLAFHGSMKLAITVGVIAGSLLSSMLGFAVMRLALARSEHDLPPAHHAK